MREAVENMNEAKTPAGEWMGRVGHEARLGDPD
jgi:hypothetical protein